MSDRLRVLHVINGEFYSGAERVQDLLALRLPEFGFDVGFACIKPNRFPQARKSQSTPLYALPMRSKLDVMRGVEMAKLIRAEGYRLVHTHTPRTAMVGRIGSALAGVPMVHHVHSPTMADTESAGRNRVNALIERASMVGVRRLVAVSNSLHDYLLREGFAEPRIRVVHNGVPTPGPLPERAAPVSPWVVGIAALFRPRKGLEVLLEACALLADRGCHLRLLAVGGFETPAYEAEIRALAIRLGVLPMIEWTGFVSDVHEQMRRMDLFVLPSLFGEGLPMVVLEAMAAGVPVVATQVEGTPEAIQSGRDGVIVRPGDAESLAQGILDIMAGKLDWSSLRASAYARQQGEFSDISMAAGVAAVYREVLPSGQ